MSTPRAGSPRTGPGTPLASTEPGLGRIRHQLQPLEPDVRRIAGQGSDALRLAERENLLDPLSGFAERSRTTGGSAGSELVYLLVGLDKEGCGRPG